MRRAHAISAVKNQLISQSFPRLQMALIVALTGGFGLLASFSMLKLGLESMVIRYPLATLLAYPFFLFLIWVWIRTNAKDYQDGADVAGLMPTGTPPQESAAFGSQGGGDFAGGGANGTFEELGGAELENSASPIQHIGDSVSSIADGEELAIPLIAVILASCIAFASLYVIYIAPILFAEVLVDGALSYVLLRRLRRQHQPHWLSSTTRHTFVPFALTALFLLGVALLMSSCAPGAQSIGEVFEILQTQPN